MSKQNIDPMVAKMEANIAEKTGRTVAAWVAIVKKSKLQKHGEIVKLLKTEHAFTHGYANLVAHRALNPAADQTDDADLVSAQYTGPKAGLKPIYDHVMKIVEGFGDGFEAAPKKAYVSLRHKKQFGLIQPSTASRVDLGINLKGKPPEVRLEASGSFNAMVSHRVRLESPADVDKQVTAWLKEAYEKAG